ncbi:MAG: hypothetical protein JSR54_05520 [Proteobacteria bacterium]|nr:hypothetical protein [Pseudomonadota bacterium]
MKGTVLGHAGGFTRRLLLLAALIAGLLVAVPWLQAQHPALAKALGSAGVLAVAGYAISLILRRQRRMDEVHLAGQGFASSYGWIWGGVATTLLLMLPPVMNRLVDLVTARAGGISTGSPGATEHLAVHLAFFYAISLVMVVQGLGVCVASFVWWRRMGRGGAGA